SCRAPPRRPTRRPHRHRQRRCPGPMITATARGPERCGDFGYGERMRIAFGTDDENETTRAVADAMAGDGHEVVPVTSSDRWPEIGAAVGRAVIDGRAERGVVMCWTGTGTAIAANKVPGVRAALAWDPWIARGSRLWNDANVLALSLKRLAPDVAVEVVRAFLDPAEPDPDELDNIAQLTTLEQRE